MKLKGIQEIYEQKDTKKGRAYLSTLIFNDKSRIKPLRVGCEYSHEGKAIRSSNDKEKIYLNKKGKKVACMKSKIRNFELFNPKGRRNIKKQIKTTKGHLFNKIQLVNDGGKYTCMHGIHEPHKLKDILGYYPHIFFKDQWRPLFYIKKSKIDLFPKWDKIDKKYYDYPHEKINDLEFFCYIYRSRKANAPKGSNMRLWGVKNLLDSYQEKRQRQYF